MPELVEQMYCSQQIVIPPKFPYILKRYCKAAIKTQPYDLLRWSYEYFRALSLHRPPPVKLRLEYPVYSTEGGLTRGCLKVLANQLAGMVDVPIPVLQQAWQGFCLDPEELRRVLCLCEVYLRQDSVRFLHFIAVAGGLLTKSLTHTMILLCETLTKEPDGGSANIPLVDFLEMYKLLARIDAGKDVRYINGYREGYGPIPEEEEHEEQSQTTVKSEDEGSVDDFWQDSTNLQKLALINDHVARSPLISDRMNQPVLGEIERSPSVERARQIERENYMRERIGKPMQNEEVDRRLQQISSSKVLQGAPDEAKEEASKVLEVEAASEEIALVIPINVYDEDGNQIHYDFFGEPSHATIQHEEEDKYDHDDNISADMVKAEEDTAVSETVKVATFVSILHQRREDRRENLRETFDELAAIVDRFKSASYDLGMVAGRQMSTTSGEFIVQHIERDIMAYIDEQIAVLPDPDLKKKKAKPEEVAMIRSILDDFIEDNIDIICPEIEEVEEEEQPVPEVTVVYAVPGIGPPVDEEIIVEFEEYARDVAKSQADVFMPRNIRHFMCPPLEKFVEYKYDEEEKKKTEEEEVVTGEE